MYSRLSDPSVSVRKNAVLVLSHLILNDMMKVLRSLVITTCSLSFGTSILGSDSEICLARLKGI